MGIVGSNVFEAWPIGIQTQDLVLFWLFFLKTERYLAEINITPLNIVSDNWVWLQLVN